MAVIVFDRTATYVKNELVNKLGFLLYKPNWIKIFCNFEFMEYENDWETILHMQIWGIFDVTWFCKL